MGSFDADCMGLALSGASNLYVQRTHDVGLAPSSGVIPAFVAQWIEQRFPKPQVACSIHAEGATLEGARALFEPWDVR
jgi:hypothetical protein